MVAAMIRVAASGLGLIFAASGVQKLAGGRSSVQVRDRLGLPRGMWRCVGLAELAGAAGVAAGLSASGAVLPVVAAPVGLPCWGALGLLPRGF